MAKALGIIKQNENAVNEFLNSIDGKEYSELREWIGVNSDGTIIEGKGAQAIYAIGSVLDTNNYFLKNDYEQGWEKYKEDFTKEDKKDEFYLHKLQLALSDFESEEFDKITWGHVKGIANDNPTAFEQLEDYFENNININGVNGSNSLANKYGGTDGYISYDSKKEVEGGIEISTGDREATTGNTVEEAQKDAAQDIVNNTNATNGNQNVETNFEESTGNPPSFYIEYIGVDGFNGEDLKLTLENLTNRVNGVLGKGKAEGFKGLLELISPDGDLFQLILSIGRYLIYDEILFYGVRTIWSGAEGKSQFKEMLPYLLAAIIFFFLAESIVDLFKEIFNEESGSVDYADMAKGVWGSIIKIVRLLAFGGIIFTGIKLMFSSAEGKADAKAHLIPVLVGCIFVFASSLVVSFVLEAAKDAGLEKSHKNYTEVYISKNIEK